MRDKCTIHGNVAYSNRAPHRPDEMAAYGNGTAAYAAVAAMRAARVPKTDAKRHTPSHPTSGKSATRRVCSSPIFPSVVNALAARIAIPVGNAET